MNFYIAKLITILLWIWLPASQANDVAAIEHVDGEYLIESLTGVDGEAAVDDNDVENVDGDSATAEDHPIDMASTASNVNCKEFYDNLDTTVDFEIIVHNDGKPMKNVKVTLNWEGLEPLTRLTNVKGIALIENVALSIPTLQVIVSGYDTYAVCVDLADLRLATSANSCIRDNLPDEESEQLPTRRSCVAHRVSLKKH